MPISAKDLPASEYLDMLVLGPPGIGKTTLIATVPLPAYVICSDPEKKLGSAQEITKNFVYDLVNSTDGPIILAQMNKAIKEAERGLAAGEYKTIVWDTVTAFASIIYGHYSEANDDDARRSSAPYTRMLLNYTRKIVGLRGHVVIMAHDELVPGATIPGQVAKRGEGILPGISGGQARTQIMALFRNKVYMQKVPDSESRILVTSIKGVYGPGCQKLKGYESVPPDVNNFIKLNLEADEDHKPPPAKAPVVPIKPIPQPQQKK